MLIASAKMGRVIHKVESRNNPGDILLPWNCASVRKSHIPHSSFKVASTPNRTKTNHHWLNHLQTLHTYYATSLAVGVSGSYLIGRKKAGKKWGIFLPTIFLPTINFYRQIFLPTFFLQTRTSIFWLKNTRRLSNIIGLSIRFKIRLRLLKLNKMMGQGKRSMLFVSATYRSRDFGMGVTKILTQVSFVSFVETDFFSKWNSLKNGF